METRNFIANYDGSQVDQIRFAWNGKHADEFDDANSTRRYHLIQACLAEPAAVPPLLWRDLYVAVTDFSVHAWCIDAAAADIARQLILSAKTEYLLDYLAGRQKSFDAHLGTVLRDIPRETLEECRSALKRWLNEATDPDERQILESGIETFESLLSSLAD